MGLPEIVKPEWALHPGVYLKEILEVYKMTQCELSKRTGVSEKTISAIVNGKAPISVKFALDLEKVFHHKAQYWLNFQTNYDLFKTNIRRKNLSEEELAFVGKFNYGFMSSKYGLKKTKSIHEKLQELLAFFGISTVLGFDFYRQNLQPQFRTASLHNENAEYNISAWLRAGQKKCTLFDLPVYNENKLIQTLKDIRSFTNLPFNEAIQSLREHCNKIGIYLQIVEIAPKSGVFGVLYWVNDKKNPCIQLTFRRKKNDSFWFSFFHEVGHLLLDSGKKEISISADDENDIYEDFSDGIASFCLIDPENYKVFSMRSNFSKKDVIKFAEENKIHPGIVVGRLQHDKKIPYSHMNDLKETYDWDNFRSNEEYIIVDDKVVYF